MSLALSRRSLRASASIWSSEARLSRTTCRIVALAAASSLTSTTFRTVRRFTMAAAIRSAISWWRGTGSDYTLWLQTARTRGTYADTAVVFTPVGRGYATLVAHP